MGERLKQSTECKVRFKRKRREGSAITHPQTDNQIYEVDRKLLGRSFLGPLQLAHTVAERLPAIFLSERRGMGRQPCRLVVLGPLGPVIASIPFFFLFYFNLSKIDMRFFSAYS